MPEISATPLEFQGVDAAECEAFIRAMTAHALAEGRQHDDQWIADYASTCFSQAGLRWWDTLEEKDQRSWNSLRRAMLLRFQPTFSGQSGEEAEAFVRMVRQKALDENKYGSEAWITAFASSCLVGDAMRWHASLDSAIQNDWKLLWPALLAQYPRDAPIVPPLPDAKRRGRVQVRRKNDSEQIFYLSKTLWTNEAQSGRIMLTKAAIEALEVVYDPATAKEQTLQLPDNQIPGCDVLGIKFYYEDTTKSDNWLALCGVNSNSGNGSPGQKYVGPLSVNTWKVSPTADSKGLRSLLAANGQAYFSPVHNSNYQNRIWFWAGTKWGDMDLELFLEQV